MFNRTLTYK